MNKHTVELLEKHFDTAFAAPDGIKKLRELILTLAMQGKLVLQDQNDTPAHELLKEIEAEKQRLVKEGKIKKSEPLPPVTEEEKPYVLPPGWAWVRLGEIGVWKSGSTPSRSNSAFYGGNIPWVKSGEVKQGRIRHTEETITQAALDKCSLNINDKGSVLVAMYGANIGEVGILEIEAATNQAVCACKTYTSFDESYLLYLITSLRPYFLSQGAGAAQPNISREKIIGTIFPLPPFLEQHRIVAKIDELMARCNELEKLRTAQQETCLTVHTAVIKQLLNIAEPDQHRYAQIFLAEHFNELHTVKENVTELRKAILQLAVMGKLVPQDPYDQPASALLKEIEAEKQRLVKNGKIKQPKPLPPVTEGEKPYVLPLGWEWVRLGDVGVFERGRSKHRPRDDKRLFEHGTYPFVQTGDVSRSKLTESQILTCNGYYNDFGLKQSHLWKKGTLCITIAANIAQTGFLGMDACIPDSVVAFLGINQTLEKLVKIFIDVAKEDLEHFAPSTAQKNINLGIINELLFPLPPLSEQQRIVAEIDRLLVLADSLDKQIHSTTSKQTEMLHALMYAQSKRQKEQKLQSGNSSNSQVIDLEAYRASIGCYAINKLANAQYFGRTAAAKVMYLAQAHIGLKLDLKPEREAAGPLDTWIYDFERQGQGKAWFEVNEKTLASGRKKTEYRCLSALSKPAAQAETLMSPSQKDKFDRLIYALADKKTEEIEIIATLFAVWNDFLIDGIHPTDEQIISDVRENWHERKARFSPAELCRWLAWLRSENIIPLGMPPRTIHQPKLRFH